MDFTSTVVLSSIATSLVDESELLLIRPLVLLFSTELDDEANDDAADADDADSSLHTLVIFLLFCK